MRISITETNNTEELLRTLRKLGQSQINVGILGGDSEMGMIAAVHEFGVDIPVTDKMRGWFGANGFPLKKTTTVIKIPERSFLRSGYDENIDSIADKVKQMMPMVLENAIDPDTFMNAIGQEFASKIKEKMQSLNNPANSSMTVERKGSSNPLIDSGRLHGSIKHEVV